MSDLRMYDAVALTEDLPDEKLQAGQVGAIVEVYNNGEAFEVDFVDSQGHTYALMTLRPSQLMLLHYQPVEIAA